MSAQHNHKESVTHMNTISLDDIKAAANEKYTHTEVQFGDGDKVVLRNFLQLNSEERSAFQEITKEKDDENADQAVMFADALTIAAEDKDAARRLFDAIDGNLATLASLFESYSKGTQAGEA